MDIAMMDRFHIFLEERSQLLQQPVVSMRMVGVFGQHRFRG